MSPITGTTAIGKALDNILPTTVSRLIRLSLLKATKMPGRGGLQAMAPEGMLDWAGKRGFGCLSEPKEFVDALLDELCFAPDQRFAVERQAMLHSAL